jgi:hypothetical protein
MATSDSLFDRRVVDRYRKGGLVNDEQIKEYLKKLPDCAVKAETLGNEPLPPQAPAPKGKGR